MTAFSGRIEIPTLAAKLEAVCFDLPGYRFVFTIGGERLVAELELERLDRHAARTCSTAFMFDGEPATLRCVSEAELPFELYEAASEIVADWSAAERFGVVRFDAAQLARVAAEIGDAS